MELGEFILPVAVDVFGKSLELMAFVFIMLVVEALVFVANLRL